MWDLFPSRLELELSVSKTEVLTDYTTGTFIFMFFSYYFCLTRCLGLACWAAARNADKLAIVHCGCSFALDQRCNLARLTHRGTSMNARNDNSVKLVLFILGTDNVKLDILALHKVLVVVGILLLHTNRLVVHKNVIALLLRIGENCDEPIARLVVEPLYHAHITFLFDSHARYLSDMIEDARFALYCFEQKYISTI